MSESTQPIRFFDSLRAETESSWLGKVFLPPREFDLMKESHSILVMGPEGSGKTTLQMRLHAHATQNEASRLIVTSWRPQLPPEGVASEDAVEAFMSQVMGTLSFAFLQAIAQEPAIYLSAPPWTRAFVPWFVQRFLQGDRDYHLGQLAEDAGSHGLETVADLLSEKTRPLFPESTAISIIPKLTENVSRLGFGGVWIFVEGLDALFRVAPGRLERSLDDFLSTLELFENPAFAFKVIVSDHLGRFMQRTRSVQTRRLKTYHLKWEDQELSRLLEKRLAVALERDSVALSDLCKDEDWVQWLGRYAWKQPRGWLESTRPILLSYLQKGKSLNKTEWREVYRQSPPPLRLDAETGGFFVGHHKVDLSTIGYKMLCYLYENRNRPCTKSEIYYRANKELAKEPRTKEDYGWEDPSSWEGMMDTALWRLRQAVEWDTHEKATPLYIVSEKGRGQIHLENTL